jgi:hypothetical protein
VNQHGFNDMLRLDVVLYFHTLKYSVFKIYVVFMLTSNYLCVYSFRPVEPLIPEHVVSLGTASVTERKLLSVQKSWIL